jgi:hypothetical protein
MVRRSPRTPEEQEQENKKLEDRLLTELIDEFLPGCDGRDREIAQRIIKTYFNNAEITFSRYNFKEFARWRRRRSSMLAGSEIRAAELVKYGARMRRTMQFLLQIFSEYKEPPNDDQGRSFYHPDYGYSPYFNPPW